MSRKGWIISAVVGLLIAIGIGSTFVFSSGKGEVMELSPLEMKKFMNEDGTGFVLLNSTKKKREDWLHVVKKVAQQEKIQVQELDEEREDIPGSSNPYDWGLSQKRDSLAYYEKGKLKKDIKIPQIKSSELEKEVTYFVQKCKEQYQK
ncbi:MULTISPECIES: hypothetical protein [Bacillus cereus group]|uniref:Uncharacterized protein n=1 Tax=Bacillus thuringiensis serovar mexicanensis TaxID=180868 RepID=A0A242W110_BACTU|nr:MULTISPECIES: hypothetical protein [Bacillus cereus group]EEM56594.1 hypothetical protein bthur0007_55450 [Bacillus thuringiensis serovar monterrey BGSC 4AJ1]MEB9673043.1 hypothetical protein [Bacillus anthracis]OTW45113.1 hypothetical protein BK699_27750 [Bacillus thuringiensis serovar mexicanensis]OTX00465.1 hypothetical protein BK705_19495 [Bacillus thuringiensis serovar monterrey]